ncbi:MAG: gliding motility-associated C-terminal domain-containing protein [Saprospiraceae bacterium]|nr:gliding motility-associated C-terminal domain-containing protein [Saprospiraceae bacterium]
MKRLTREIQTPLLADIDGDCMPELIVLDTICESILIINPITGVLKNKIKTYFLNPYWNSYCLADIDFDGEPEFFVIASSFFTNPINIRSRIICYNKNGVIRWISDQRVDRDYNNKIIDLIGIPAIADFNQDGIPEIYVSNKIFNAQTGVKLADGGPNGIGADISPGIFIGPCTIASQLDMDTFDLELAAGYTVYKVKIVNPNGLFGNSMTPINIKVNNEYKDGATTVGDVDQDGHLDIIVTTPGIGGVALIYMYTIFKGLPILIAKVNPPGAEVSIGATLIGDIKGLGKISILINRVSKLYAYSYNGTGFLQQDWVFTTTDSSGSTGLTIFDFNNDGKQEIVIRDMTSLKIIDGSGVLPKLKGQVDCFAHTWFENPIVGGFDSANHAMICVPCLSSLNETNGKLTIFGPPDSLPGWAPARGIWNQYNYHVLNINDDLTVPRVQKNNATYKNGKYNNFFVQESLLDSNGMYLKRAASLTGKIKCINYDPIKEEYTVIFDIHNRQDASFIADSSLPVSFYNGDPSTGGILIGTYYTFKKLFGGDSLLNLEFKFSVSNLADLFMVINTTRNGSGQFDPTDFSIAECDYTDNIFRTLELPKIEKLNASICNGDTYNFYDTLLNNAGMYYHKLSAVKGCDSLIFILELTLVDSVHTTQSIIACDGYSWNGTTYTQSGSFIFDTINQFGCDSITTLELIINKSNNINIQHTACDSFTWNGNTYDKSGSYPFQTKNNLGCDSITTLELVINKSDDKLIYHTACNSYTWNGQIYTQSGTYKFDTVNRFGCDSAVSLDLTINSIINVNLVDAACDSYTWNGNTYIQSGTYQYKTINQQGCDSITTLQLKINKSNNSTTSLTTCDNYTWNGVTYNQSGIYQQKTLNNSGCDSTATLQLTINKSSNSVIDNTSCDSYTWNGNTYTQSGSYQYQTLNVSGCDSIATLKLIINKSDQLNIKQTTCDTFTWNGNTYDKSGSYPYQTVNNLGCDSVINLNLNINKSSKADLALSVCDSLNFLGKTLKANGNYTFKVQNVAGCDSVINLSLNIRSEFYNNSISSCDSFTWNLNGQSYNQSGIYLKKYFNSFGCDSIYTLDLNIFRSYELVEQAEVCKEYLWQVNKTLLKQSGEYTHPLKTIQGCDSIIKLNLFVNHDFEKADTVVTDSAYTWFVNHQTYPISGIYQEHFISSTGCDSIHLLFLTIKKDIGIYYPNVIRPGGPNGWFTIFDNGHTISLITTLSVYDRWGDLIWQKHGILPNDLHMGWDGKFNGQNVMPGVYVWHAQITLQDGSVITKKGDVTAVR